MGNMRGFFQTEYSIAYVLCNCFTNSSKHSYNEFY